MTREREGNGREGNLREWSPKARAFQPPRWLCKKIKSPIPCPSLPVPPLLRSSPLLGVWDTREWLKSPSPSPLKSTQWLPIGSRPGTSGPGSNFHLVNRRGFASALPTGQVTDTCFPRPTIVARPAYDCSLQVYFSCFLHPSPLSSFPPQQAYLLAYWYVVQRTGRVPVADDLPRNLPAYLPDQELSSYNASRHACYTRKLRRAGREYLDCT